jgi:RNA polymerase sigma-70 factor (ECF subfamily)
VTRRLAVSIHPIEVNGHPGALLIDSKSRVAGVWALDIADGEIQAVQSVVNPDKLRHLGTVADVGELVKVARIGRA